MCLNFGHIHDHKNQTIRWRDAKVVPLPPTPKEGGSFARKNPKQTIVMVGIANGKWYYNLDGHAMGNSNENSCKFGFWIWRSMGIWFEGLLFGCTNIHNLLVPSN